MSSIAEEQSTTQSFTALLSYSCAVFYPDTHETRSPFKPNRRARCAMVRSRIGKQRSKIQSFTLLLSHSSYLIYLDTRTTQS